MNVMEEREKEVEKQKKKEPPAQLRIIDIWDYNFFEELEKIVALLPEYRYIAMDTEFPGYVEVPRVMTEDYEYQLVKINVDDNKLIQLGITLFDDEGNTPSGACCWQFNFKYDMEKDKYNKDSIKILKQAGINFEKHKSNGIDQLLFGEYFLTSGLVLSSENKWICFQGNQDFGYMYRVLANTHIPDSEDGFLSDTKVYFPNLYDIKYMKHEYEELRGGLQRAGDLLGLDRIGQMHQAGSDSWLTGLCYFKLLETYLHGKDIPSLFNNILYGLGESVNTEEYLESYTSRTDKLEREARENQETDEYIQNDHYYNYQFNQAQHAPPEGYAEYYPQEYNQHIAMQPSPHLIPPMNSYGQPQISSPNMHPRFNISPQMEFQLDEKNQINYDIMKCNNNHNSKYQDMTQNPNQHDNYPQYQNTGNYQH